MVGAKVVAVLCALLVVQAQASVPRTEPQQLTGLLDGLIEIINAAEAAILNGLESIKLSAQDSERVLQVFSEAIVSGTRSFLIHFYKDMGSELDKLKNQAEGDVTVDIAVRFVGNSLGCVNSNFDHVAHIIPPWIDQIEAVLRTVHDTTNGLEECNKLNLLELISCVREVVDKASKDIKPIAGIIDKGVNDIGQAIEEYLERQAGACVKEQAQLFKKEVLDAFNVFATCATK
nr:unnamed protein product [Callosobruchus analis]